MFYKLPHDIRKEFDNDINKFTKNGRDYLDRKIQKFKEEELKIKENQNINEKGE